MFDVSRIEVLRGPQGTLFGKNTVAGVYNVVTNSPTDKLSADVDATFGSFGERRFEGGVGGMVNGWLGMRAAFLDWRRDGRLDNTTLDDRNEDKLRQQAGRLKVTLLPTDSIDIELSGTTSDTGIPFWPFQLKNLDAGTRAFLRGYDPRVEDDPFNFETSMNTDGHLDKGSDTIGAKTTWTTGKVGPFHESDIVLVLGRSDLSIRQLSDLDVSPADIAGLRSAEDYLQHSLELRAHGLMDGLFGKGWIEGFGGVYLLHTRYHLRARIEAGEDLGAYLLTNDAAELATKGAVPNLPIRPLPRPLVPSLGPVIGEDYYGLDFEQTTTTVAPFGQATWEIGRWSITPGVRINWEKKDADATGKGVCAGKDVLGTCVMETVIGGADYALRGAKRDELDVSPKISVLYHWSDAISLYASWAKGFKSGGVNAISLNGGHLEFEPENAKTVEVGAKTKFFDDTLSANLAFYRTKFDNLQVLAFNGVFLDVKNAAEATSQGMELEGEWLTPYEPLTIAGSLGLLRARYDSYRGAPAPVGQGIGALQDLSGERIAFAPDQTMTVTPTFEYRVFRGWPLTVALDVQYVGDQFTDTDLDPATRVPSHFEYSLRTRVGGAPEKWSVTFGVKDLTDERVLNQVTDAVFFPGTYYAQAEQARVFFGSLRYEF